MNKVHLCDCMEFMKGIPDKYYELAIVDPPYGIDVANMNMGVGKGKRASKIENRKWYPKDWDIKPTQQYFEELFRVSQNQIIWGGNYFNLPISQYFAIWDKGNGIKGRSFAECEYAWVSSGGTRIIKLDPFDKDRIHPTQKPVALYKWLLKNYAKPNDKIFDSHVGSGSIRIACHDMGFSFEGCEIDKDYWEAQEERYNQHAMQGDLFTPELLFTGEIQQELF
jgi:site-specific DNA-methyltransferase (adenine-specific)